MIFIELVLIFKWLVVIAGAGARFLKMEFDARIFFGPNNPQLKALQAFKGTCGKNVYNIFVIEPENGGVFTRETLSAAAAKA